MQATASSLEEIEARLQEHDSVDLCIVTVREDTPGKASVGTCARPEHHRCS